MTEVVDFIGLSDHTLIYHPPLVSMDPGMDENQKKEVMAIWKKHPTRQRGYGSSWEAHRAVCRNALHQKLRRILVLEDDAAFIDPSYWLGTLRKTVQGLESQGKAWSRILLGYVPFFVWPSDISLPFLTFKGSATSIHAYVANVDELCHPLYLTPFFGRNDVSGAFGQRFRTLPIIDYVNNLNVASYKFLAAARSSRQGISAWPTLLYNSMSEIPNRSFQQSHTTPSLDFYLQNRVCQGTYLIYPMASWQFSAINDQVSLVGYFRGFSEQGMYYIFLALSFVNLLILFIYYLILITPWKIVRSLICVRKPRNKIHES